MVFQVVFQVVFRGCGSDLSGLKRFLPDEKGRNAFLSGNRPVSSDIFLVQR